MKTYNLRQAVCGLICTAVVTVVTAATAFAGDMPIGPAPCDPTTQQCTAPTSCDPATQQCAAPATSAQTTVVVAGGDDQDVAKAVAVDLATGLFIFILSLNSIK
jgi:hypothetical protein